MSSARRPAASSGHAQWRLTRSPCWASTEGISGLVVVVGRSGWRMLANLDKAAWVFGRGSRAEGGWTADRGLCVWKGLCELRKRKLNVGEVSW
jgi:hypothetical protein